MAFPPTAYLSKAVSARFGSNIKTTTQARLPVTEGRTWRPQQRRPTTAQAQHNGRGKVNKSITQFKALSPHYRVTYAVLRHHWEPVEHLARADCTAHSAKYAGWLSRARSASALALLRLCSRITEAMAYLMAITRRLSSMLQAFVRISSSPSRAKSSVILCFATVVNAPFSPATPHILLSPDQAPTPHHSPSLPPTCLCLCLSLYLPVTIVLL